jgi:acetyltransferase-like isoleucine patch superfamily enzyme
MPKTLGKRKKDLVIVGPYQPIIPVINDNNRVRLTTILSEILMPGELDGGIKVTGNIDDLPEIIKEWNVFVIITLMIDADKVLRKKFWRKIDSIERGLGDEFSEKLETLIHSNNVIDSSIIGNGSVIFPFNTIIKSSLDTGCIVKPSCYIKEGTSIGKYCVIESGVHIGRNVNIGSCAFIGANSTIADDVKISSFTDIIPNTFVSKNIKNEREL